MKNLARELSGRFFCQEPVLRWARARRHGPPYGAVIVNFHSFCSDSDPRLRKGPSVHTGVADFDRFLEVALLRFRPISLDTLAWHLVERIGLEEDSMAITIDDGYRDNYDLGMPILIQRKFPATVYVTTGYIETGRVLPLDRVEYVLRNTPRTQGFITCLGEKISFDTKSSREAINRRVAAAIKALDCAEAERAIEEFATELQVSLSELPDVMLSWQQIREMRANGITIGSHGVSHTCMARMTYEAAVQELIVSRDTITRMMGEPPRHFAYPNGRAEDFNDALRRAADLSGYTTVVSSVRGINWPGHTDRLSMLRVGNIGTPESTMLYIERLMWNGRRRLTSMSGRQRIGLPT